MRMIFLGIFPIVIGSVLIVMGILESSQSQPDLMKSDRATHRLMNKAMLSETGLAVLRAIPFKNYDISDAETGRVTNNDLAQERLDIDRTRAWANTLEDGTIKLAYLGWLEHFEKTIPKVEEELQTHTIRDKSEKEETARQELMRTLPKPP